LKVSSIPSGRGGGGGKISLPYPVWEKGETVWRSGTIMGIGRFKRGGGPKKGEKEEKRKVPTPPPPPPPFNYPTSKAIKGEWVKLKLN